MSAFATTQSTAPNAVLPSKAFRFEDLPVRESPPVRIYQVFTGTTHSGYMIDMHETDLAPGQAPHDSHHHVHEELILIREGLVEFNIAGQKTQLGPGSCAYIASNQDHGLRNVGTIPAQYFVLALGQDQL
jgi:mannose-6-phosphate isomerase-like protein (cupin superfamily)